MEARLAQKRSELKSLSAKLETAQRQLSQRTADAELANQQTTLTMTQAQHQITAYAIQAQLIMTNSSSSASLLLSCQPWDQSECCFALSVYDDDPDLAIKSFTISSQMTDHAKLSNQLPWYLRCSCCDDVTGSQASGVIGCTCCRLEGHLKDSSARAAHLTAKLTASEADLKQGAVSF